MSKAERFEQAMQLLEEGINKILTSETWKEVLKVQSQFHKYSFHNTVLIFTQYPKATKVAGYKTWEKLGRYVKKGEKAIWILAPIIKNEVIVDEETGEEEIVQRVVGFKPVPVFDISQTDGNPLPTVTKRLEGETDLYEIVKSACPIPVEELNDCGGANGYYNRVSNRIAILSSLSTVHKTKTLIHEMAHYVLHNLNAVKESGELDRSIKELEAESTAFVVCHHLGLDTSDFSFGYIAEYIATWGNGEPIKLLKQVGSRIQKASSKIIFWIEAKMGSNQHQNQLVEEEELV